MSLNHNILNTNSYFKSYSEVILTSIKLAVNDIVLFSKNTTPENIAAILGTAKKQNAKSNNLVKYWHPSDYLGAFDFLFSDEPIIRESNLGSIDCSLKSLAHNLPNVNSIKEIRESLIEYISCCLGYFPVQGCGLKIFVKTSNEELNVKKLETHVFDKLVQLTREGKLEWNLSAGENEKGAVPSFVDNREMSLEKTYLANYEDAKGVLTCTLSKYLKSTAKKKNYTEYIIHIQLIQEKNDSTPSHLVSKGMGKLWKVVDKQEPLSSGSLSIKELSSFLSGLCE